MIGIDIDGDEVWKADNGKVFAADDKQEAETIEQKMETRPELGFAMSTYVQKWGPIR